MIRRLKLHLAWSLLTLALFWLVLVYALLWAAGLVWWIVWSVVLAGLTAGVLAAVALTARAQACFGRLRRPWSC